ncbi:MAG: oxidoreductase [Acidobacteria bacterium]|nr:MAG: oxidoreductase [Acidobacteriota bacterium]
MSSKIKVGLVGAKFAARFHFEGYQRVYGVPLEVIGVTSKSKESREAFAAKHQIRAFDSLQEMFKEVDVVDICAPGYVHESAAVEAFGAGKHVIVEKPFTGYYGPGAKNFRGNQFSKETMLKEAMASSRRILDAAARSGKKLMYAEDWVYAPVVQREREILVASKGQILWMLGEESHSGSHSPSYGIWAQAGGGSIVGKGCHPLTAAMYLKQEEGLASQGKPIRPRTISARVHEVTRNPQYRDLKYLRTDYEDVEDYSQLHLVFEDGMIADIFSTEIVMGGVHNWLEVMANNHRTRCNINPIDAITTYNPKEEQLKDVYIVEKIGTKQGWSHPAPDEDWMDGYPQELQDFMECVYHNREPKCGATLAHDTVGVMYSAYLSAERHGAEVEIPR